MILFLFLHLLVILVFYCVWRVLSDRERGLVWPGGTPVEISSPGRFMVKLALLALALRLLCLAVIMLFFPEMIDRASAIYGWRDDLTYHEDATAFMRLWKGEYDAPSDKTLTIDYVGYPLLLAAIYYVTGPYHLVGMLFNIVFGVLTCLLTYLLGRETFDEDVGRQAAVLLAVLPLHIYICCFTLKDPLLLLLIMLAVYCGRQMVFGKRAALWLVLACLSLAAMLVIRRQVGLVLGGLIGAGLLLSRPWRAVKLTPLAVVLLLATYLGYSQFQEFTLRDYFSENILEDQYEMVLSMQAMTPELEKKGSLLLPLVGYILPFPTLYPLEMSTDPAYQLESSAFLWNLVAGLSLVGILICWRRRFRDTWLIWAPPLVFYFGQAFMYLDTILDLRRGKFMLTPFACLLAVYALREWKSPARRLWFFLYVVMVFFGTLLYTYYRLSSRGMI